MTDKLRDIALLVCGGREYDDTDQLDIILRKMHAKYHIALMIEGEAAGADYLCKMWALLNNIPVRPFSANWELYGNYGGCVRNSKMLREGRPDIALAFPGETGTADMISKCVQAGLRIIIGKWSDGPGSKIIWELIHGGNPI